VNDSGLPKRVRVLWVGKSFTPTHHLPRNPNGYLLPFEKISSKPDRRMHRRRARYQASSIEQAIAKAQKARLDIEKLATNSHEARRYWAADRMERSKP